jgi:hypothetical protein
MCAEKSQPERGRERFERAVANLATNLVERFGAEDYKLVQHRIGRLIAFEAADHDRSGPEPTSYERCVFMLIAGLSEIGTIYEGLLDIAIYLSRFPYRNTRVTEERYLRYQITNYLPKWLHCVTGCSDTYTVSANITQRGTVCDQTGPELRTR